MTKREEIEELYDDLIFMDGYDDCIVGVMERYGAEPVVLYDKCAVIDVLVRDGMTEEEAYEFFEFNQLGAWVGEKTPAFVELFS